ncbi:hypothetical protein [Streptomyces sp. NPDC048172]|uniref:hypothetical protein n=1 Tax=Streptomyces sp. NPDC048172 TaxID=3365505 RepID=UPI003718115D
MDNLKAALAGDSDPRDVQVLRRDVVALAETMDVADIETLWTWSVEGGFRFGLRISSGQEWMRIIAGECTSWLSTRGEEELSAEDLDPGRDHVDEALGEISSLARTGFDESVISALSRCVRQCSPELGIRFLLRAVSATGTDIGREQYERLLRLGDAFRYGRFVVPEVEGLISWEG